MRPLAIDLYCGLGGWAEGLLSEGYDVIGFDIERHDYGTGGYPGQLVLQDVLTLHGRQFKGATIIVASPPCQAYSYRAMPWKRAKALPPPDNSLFDACFRIQREASEAAGRYIPMIVENVRGAQKWVGRSRWHYGSYHLWGDVPALMVMIRSGRKHDGSGWTSNGLKVPGFRFDGSGKSFQTASVKEFGWNQNEKFQAARREGIKQQDGRGKGWFGEYGPNQGTRNTGSKSNARKAASAMIAKIPFPLAQYIARIFKAIPA
jgi:hypothetical protein